MADIEEQSKELKNDFENVEKNIQEVLKTLETNCDAWDSCIDILKSISNEKNILITFPDPDEDSTAQSAVENDKEKSEKVQQNSEDENAADADGQTRENYREENPEPQKDFVNADNGKSEEETLLAETDKTKN